MNNKRNDNDSIFQLPVKDLMIQTFKLGKAQSFENGAISALINVRNNLSTIASVTKNRNLSLMYMDINVITSLLINSRDTLIKRITKEELQKIRAEENVDIFLKMIDSLQDFDYFIEMDFVQGQKLLEKINHIVEILPSDEKESMVLDICRSIQSGFYRAVHEELPKSLEDFYESILEAFENESYENAKNIIELEKLKWHSLSFGFP